MDISIFIIHWNTPQILESQLQKCFNGFKGDLIVIDNNSTDKITFQHKYPNITFIQNNKNRGFAFACNQAGTHAKGKWILFLNPDVELSQSQLNQLRLYAEKNDLDAVSPDFTDNNYRKPIPSPLSLLAEFTPFKYLIPKTFFTSRTLVGGCLLIKKKVFIDLGGYDERFFLWFEDSDLTKRFIDCGYKIGFAQSNIVHSGGASFKKMDTQYKRDIFFNSLDVYAKKHFTYNGQFVVSLIKKRYSKNHILPHIHDGSSITVANMSVGILESFLKTNFSFFSERDEFIIVTSAITDKDIWAWRQKYPNIRFITIVKNMGFAHTVNIGFRVSTGAYIATVNDDTVLNNEWTGRCVSCLDDKTGSINPVIKQSDGSVESAGIKILSIGKAQPTKEFNKEVNCFTTDATNAAAVLYSRNALNTVGLFDESFGSYLEDIDLSLQIHKAGYKNIVSTNASIIHIGHQSSKNFGAYKNYLDFKNWILVIAKNWGVIKIMKNLPQIIIERGKNLSGIVKSINIPTR